MTMRVLVTRPAAQAVEWVERLRVRGIDAQALPLIAIEPAADLAPLRSAWQALAEQRMVVFVSAHAAQQFFAHRGLGAWPSNVLAASTGPGTTQALQRLSVPAEQIVEPAPNAAQFDSESLWEELKGRDWRAARVLCVRADDGREWLAERLREAGATVAFVAAYRRVAPSLNRLERQLLRDAMAQPRRNLWWFTSSEAIDHLAKLTPTKDWSRAHALVTHPRIADKARALGFGHVLQAPPQSDAVLGAIKRSIQSAAS